MSLYHCIYYCISFHIYREREMHVSLYMCIYRDLYVFTISTLRFTSIYRYIKVYMCIYRYTKRVKEPENRTQTPRGSGAGKLLMCWCGHGRMGTSWRTGWGQPHCRSPAVLSRGAMPQVPRLQHHLPQEGGAGER